MINQTRQQTKYCLRMSSQSSKKGHHSEDDEAAFEKLRREIEASQDNALSLCTEKVLLARQAHDLVSFLALSLSWFVAEYCNLFANLVLEALHVLGYLGSLSMVN